MVYCFLFCVSLGFVWVLSHPASPLFLLCMHSLFTCTVCTIHSYQLDRQSKCITVYLTLYGSLCGFEFLVKTGTSGKSSNLVLNMF